MDYIKIAENTAKGVVEVKGSAAEIVAAFRSLKKAKAELHGKVVLSPTDRMEGLNIRKTNLRDSAAMKRLFQPFTSWVKEPLTFPLYDESRNALVATDGEVMLFCDIPDGFTSDEAKKDNNFTTDFHRYPNWTIPLGSLERKNTPYDLASLTKMAEFEKCDDMHNAIAIAAASAKAYHHVDSKGFAHNLYAWIGEKQYNPMHLYAVVEGLFRLGCEGIGLFDAGTRWSFDRHPLHVVGFGDGLNARGLVMPMRFPSTAHGAVEFPINKKAAKVAA